MHHAFSLGSATTSGFNLNDGNIHTAKIEYVPGTMTIFVDDLANPILTVDVDLAQTLDLDEGHAWIGFTAATGGDSTNHDILNWVYNSVADMAPVVIISDVEQLEADDGTTTDFAFTVTRLGHTFGTVTVDWTTADGTAAAGSDYVASSGRLTFEEGGATKQTIYVPVNGDGLREGREYFLVD
ncbi:unnamed protein product, partial [marine sediment metagenome]